MSFAVITGVVNNLGQGYGSSESGPFKLEFPRAARVKEGIQWIMENIEDGVCQRDQGETSEDDSIRCTNLA